MPTASRKGSPPMSDKLIKNGRVVADHRLTVTLAEGEAPTDIAVPAGPVLVPLAVWQARRDEFLERARSGELGVWLAAGEDVAALADDVSLLSVIGLQFHLEMTEPSLRAIVDNCRGELLPARWIQDEATILGRAGAHFTATSATAWPRVARARRSSAPPRCWRAPVGCGTWRCAASRCALAT